eukprot:g4537.t1
MRENKGLKEMRVQVSREKKIDDGEKAWNIPRNANSLFKRIWKGMMMDGNEESDTDDRADDVNEEEQYEKWLQTYCIRFMVDTNDRFSEAFSSNRTAEEISAECMKVLLPSGKTLMPKLIHSAKRLGAMEIIDDDDDDEEEEEEEEEEEDDDDDDVKKSVPAAVLIEVLTQEKAATRHMPVQIWMERTDSQNDMHGRPFTRYIFRVSNGELSWLCKRRYREFAAMHAELQRAWRDLTGRQPRKFPELPGKTRLQTKLSEKVVESRKEGLQQYLRLLSMDEWCFSQPCVLSFLGLMSESRHAVVDRSIVHISMVRDFVRVGDIVLFKSSTTASALQRAVTLSEFDHVAIVCETIPGVPQLLEATGDGVQTYPLIARLRAYMQEFAKHVAIRRFIGDSDRDAATEAINDFVRGVEGSEYSIAIHKFLRVGSQSTSPVDEELDSKQKWFCSEVVAAALQHAGFLDYGSAKRNSSFWPRSFCPGGLVEKYVCEGWMLDELTMIDSRIVELVGARTASTRRLQI